MDERSDIVLEINSLQELQRQLEVKYEQYFAGVEKREPMQDKDALTLRMRKLIQRTVIQTDLRFKIASLSSRFQTYNQHWTRILRLIDEGKYHRGGTGRSLPTVSAKETEDDRLYRQLTEINPGNGDAKAPDREKFQAYMKQQRERVQQKYGDLPVEFSVKAEKGKARIVIRRKR